ncbi:Protein of unknown function [Gryllus bimaculatus]|nr:Protein of unknown function [Gryllus bimaculatus]
MRAKERVRRAKKYRHRVAESGRERQRATKIEERARMCKRSYLVKSACFGGVREGTGRLHVRWFASVTYRRLALNSCAEIESEDDTAIHPRIMIYQAILIYLLECGGQIITACPSLCNCDSKTRTLSCHGWKDTSPPNVSNPDRYEFLDLSSDSGTKYLETECIDLTHLKARAGVPLPSQAEAEGEGAGGGELLGDALEAGRLPASWLGVGRFIFLKLLRMCGVGLRLVHKDAFRYQLMLRCIDLSHNHLQRLNLFTWQRHDELHSLILAEIGFV